MAVLSKAGCNQGVCHGNQNGKNGFKLSLRGEDPAWDYRALTRDMLGRRINKDRPAESLILIKPTASIPHEGGRRFGVDSPEYRILAGWIALGAPLDPPKAPVLKQISVTPSELVLTEPASRVQLHVEATFSDGAVRDVTRLAVYEPSNPAVEISPQGEVINPIARSARKGPVESSILVRYLDQRATVQLAFVPARHDFQWHEVHEANYIDHYVFAKLRTLRISSSRLCSDSMFLRRAYLDALGILPKPEEVRAFLEDKRSDKRARLIDRLLNRPEFADFWALKWSDVLHNEEKTLDRKGVQAFHRWIRDCIAQGKPLNEFARELIAAKGSTYRNPATNFYRALRDPESRAEAFGEVFLGIRLQCAKCHNHPFDQWTQKDYYSLSAFFARIQYKILENQRKDRLDGHEFDGEQVVWEARKGEVEQPRTHEKMSPRYLGQSTATLAGDVDRLEALADWVARPDNPFFARTQVNRVWYHLMGRGIVEPNDDFRASNPPSNGPLLEALTRDFAEHHFNLRYLARTIMNSRTYQLSAVPNETNQEDETNFSHALLRPLQAEPLLDALSRVTEVPVKFTSYPLGMRAGEMPGVRPAVSREQRPTSGEVFLKQFGKPDRLLTCECERSDDATLGRAFQLLTGELLNRLLTTPENRLGRLLADGKSDREIIEELYLASLSRPPRESEQKAASAFLAKSKNRRTGLEDFLAGLLNSKEFLLRQ
jgi:Protein of unknown function (DUF1549)/Protein of unknown function (DUF1553)